MAQPTTLVELLERAARRPDTGLRVLDRMGRAEWLPWPHVRGRALRVAGNLQAAGVMPGDRVVLIYPTSAGFFDAFFGVLAAGAVPVPLYPPARLGRLVEYVEQTAGMTSAVGARVILADRAVRRVLGEAVRRAGPPLGCSTLEDLPPGEPRPVPVSASDLALIQFSSGTTRDPRAVALSHRAVVSQAETLNGFWPDAGGVVHSGVSWLPLYHDMGLIGCVFPALERPGTLTLIPPEAFVASPAVWLQTISRYAATISPAPNFSYGLCVRKVRDEQLEGVDLSSWRVALNGAETVVPDVMRAFQRRFARWGFRPEALTPVYGLSEASLAVTFSSIDRPFTSVRLDRRMLDEKRVARETPDGREIASAGKPLPSFELRIVSPEGAVLGEGVVGEVECRGASLMDGYFGQPEATALVFHDGWLRTGDLGFLRGGELFLTGRARDILLLRGRNYPPEEVERVVDGVPGVRPGCAVAVSRLTGVAESEQLLVFVEAARGVDAGRYGSIAGSCSSLILKETGLLPENVIVVPPGALPRTSSGKMRRGESLRRFAAGELTPPPPVTAARLAHAVARSRLGFLGAWLSRLAHPRRG